MGFLSKLLNKDNSGKQLSQTTAVSKRNSELQVSQPVLNVHPDIRDFLWIANGKYKNYTPAPANDVINISANGITLKITFCAVEEPSLIYMNLPIASGNGIVDRPPYYPTYKELTPEQRGVYWKLLSNPYDNTIDIGFVFVLYYGLERYLLSDQYEAVIDVILKLRDVHQNKSFQTYTANAIILTCLSRQRADIVKKFMNSLDKEFEFSFSPNLFLLCKYALGSPLEPAEIMRIPKSFEFNKINYIKKYPDMFLNALSKNIKEDFKADSISWNKLLSNTDFNKLPKEDTPIFANVSIREKTIGVPKMIESFQFKRKIYSLLEKSHEDVKKQLATMRKNGEDIVEEKHFPTKQSTEVATFDTMLESELLNAYNSAKPNSLDQHFVSISLQKFYYKYRNLDRVYLEKCIEYCKDDIRRLPEIQRMYIEDEKSKIQSSNWLTKEEMQVEMSKITPFYADIPAFKRLAIIYEKEKDYDSAMSICDQAISYYSGGNIQSQVSEFSERRNKLTIKASKC